MLEAIFRPVCQRYLVEPFAITLWQRVHCHPISVTLFSGITGIAAGILTGLGDVPYLAVALLLVSGFLDMVDGTLARLYTRATPLGALLDILMDRCVEASMVCGLFFLDVSSRAIPCLFMLVSILLCITSFLTVAIFSANDTHKSFYYSPGLMERAEAFIFFILMILCKDYFNALAWTFSGLVLLTAFIRVWEFGKKIT